MPVDRQIDLSFFANNWPAKLRQDRTRMRCLPQTTLAKVSHMNLQTTYHIGTPGQKWGQIERDLWLQEQSVKRSYQEEVLDKLEPLKARFAQSLTRKLTPMSSPRNR